jgi:hypothetical protein
MIRKSRWSFRPVRTISAQFRVMEISIEFPVVTEGWEQKGSQWKIEEKKQSVAEFAL